MLAVALKLVFVQADLLQRVEERVDRAVAGALQLDLVGAVNEQSALEMHIILAVFAFFINFSACELIFGRMVEIVVLKDLKQLLGDQLALELLTLCLHQLGELRMHALGQVVAEGVAHHKRGAALSGLRVDADDRLIFSADVRRIDGQIGDLPVFGTAVAHILIALVDSVLMGAGEGGEHQLADIGLTRVDTHIGAALVDVAEMGEMTEIELRVNALCVHIQAHGDDIHIAGALAVAKERALHALGACQQRQLAGGNAAAAVVVRMNADDRRITVLQMADKVFDLVGIGVGCAHLNGVRQVEDHRVFLGRAELFDHAVADGNGVVRLGAAEALGRIFKTDVGVACIFVGQSFDQTRALHGDVDHALHVGFENDLSLQGRSGIIEMHDDILRALDRLKGLVDQVLACLHQNLDRHIVGDMVLLDQLTADLILGFRGARKADLDFLKAYIDQGVEEFELFFEIHRVDQRLVAVAQINAAPDGRLVNDVVRPLAVGQINLFKGDVLVE